MTFFKGVTLEVGGDLETYWRTSAIAYASLAPPPTRTTRRPNHIGTVQASPVYTTTAHGGGVLTISSLQGDYIHVVLQVTRDFHPVVFSDWLLPCVGLDIGVADVTLAQFEALAKSLGRSDLEVGSMSTSARAAALSQTMVSLDNLLKVSRLHNACTVEANVRLDYSARDELALRFGISICRDFIIVRINTARLECVRRFRFGENIRCV